MLLGLNCAFGPGDCGELPLSALDLDGGWVTFPRPKTGLPRRCSLWPETVEAIEETLARRPPPIDKAAQKLALLREDGSGWIGENGRNPLTERFWRVLRRLGLYRKQVGFYSLRRTFRTIADETLDFPAVDLIMGHARKGTGDLYRQRIDDRRLIAVSDHVRQWLLEGGQGDE